MNKFIKVHDGSSIVTLNIRHIIYYRGAASETYTYKTKIFLIGNILDINVQETVEEIDHLISQ